MGDWKIIQPVATTNLLRDTSFDLPDPDTMWTILGDGVPDALRISTEQFFGPYCASVSLGSGGTYTDIYQFITTVLEDYTLSAIVKRIGGGVVTNSHVQAFWRGANYDFDSIDHIRDD